MNTNLSDKYGDRQLNFKPIYVYSKVIHQSDHFDNIIIIKDNLKDIFTHKPCTTCTHCTPITKYICGTYLRYEKNCFI